MSTCFLLQPNLVPELLTKTGIFMKLSWIQLLVENIKSKCTLTRNKNVDSSGTIDDNIIYYMEA